MLYDSFSELIVVWFADMNLVHNLIVAKVKMQLKFFIFFQCMFLVLLHQCMFNIDKKNVSFFSHQISISEWFLKDQSSLRDCHHTYCLGSSVSSVMKYVIQPDRSGCERITMFLGSVSLGSMSKMPVWALSGPLPNA